MQTFLPYEDFERSAKVLDYRRLGKQRVEAYQILQALHNPEHGYRNHSAVKMWYGYADALVAYYYEICREWIRRGYKHTMPIMIPKDDYECPHWLGDEQYHYAHRSNLYYKRPDIYTTWMGIEKVNYYWPNGKDKINE